MAFSSVYAACQVLCQPLTAYFNAQGLAEFVELMTLWDFFYQNAVKKSGDV